MKRSFRLLLSVSVICVCALMLLSASFTMFAVSAQAVENYAAEVNSRKYEKYSEAWAAVSNGGTITMLSDWSISSVLAVNENKTVTVNMNGFMINRALSSKTSSGQVFLVKSGAVLNIIGEKDSQTEHMGTIQNDAWHFNANGIHAIYGALITGGYNSNGGGAIHVQENGQVNVQNVTIAGNVSTDGSGAGAIRLQGDDSRITLTDSEICYNKATDGGGAISVKGSGAVVQLLGTHVNNNTVTDDNGGAILISDGTVSIARSSSRVSEISYNNASDNGGAIYISNGDLLIHENTIIACNTAGEEGGAIYVDSGADKVEIKGIYSGNSAMDEGGAIYVNSDVSGEKGVKISNAEFLGNHSVLHGGAIFVDSDNDITLSGKVITNGNSPDNLYIKNSKAIVSNSLTSGSKVGITTSWDATKDSPIATSNYQYFVSDRMGYEMKGEGSGVYYAATSIGAPESITVGNDTYPVIKDTFQYYPNSGGQSTGYFYYSDGYFAESARYYNEHLATMSTCVSVAAVNSLFEGEHTPYKAARNIMNLYESIGFKALYINYPEPTFYGEDGETLATIGFVIAYKDITVNGKTEKLVAIAVRGGKYGAEWASNVVIGDGVGEARGFKDAADQVERGLEKYLADYEIDPSNAKFWITGFSRAAATSNLVAKRLTDSYGEDNVYAYCFETPKGGVHSLLKEGIDYANIHNIINATDIVPFVATTEMGFIRYGVDHILPSYKVGTDEYKQQKQKMLAQLTAIAPDAVFNDYFHEATVSYVIFALQSFFVDGADLVKEETFPDFGTAAEWNYEFVKKMQKYSLTNNVKDSIYNKDSVNWHGYRNYWSGHTWYLYEDSNGDLLIKSYGTAPTDVNSGKYTALTLEKSISTVMNFYFTLDDEKKNAILGTIDLAKIQENVKMKNIYDDIIGTWHEFSIEDKNKYFNKYWNATKIEDSLLEVLTSEEVEELKYNLFVILDFGLDFVGEDYDHDDQDLIGTLVYNMSSIMQTHNYEILCAWARSYDSFYASGDLVSPPIAPSASVKGGVYNDNIVIELTAENGKAEIYYTLDGTVPSITNGHVYNPEKPIELELVDGQPTITTLKAITVLKGISSEVVTYNYTLNNNAEIEVREDVLHISNVENYAYLVLAEYDGEYLQDIEYFAVNDDYYFSLEESRLNFENKIVAYLLRDLESLNPLCAPICLTDVADKIENICVNTQNNVVIESFEAEQALNPEFINLTFKIAPSNAEILTVALYEKNSHSGLESAIHFGYLEKTEDNTYTFTVQRSRLKEMIGGASVNDTTLVLYVGANGNSKSDFETTLYKESVFTITYHLDGGVNNPQNPEVYSMYGDVVILYMPAKEHYLFGGWFMTADFQEGTNDFVIDCSMAKNIDVYAKWEIRKYTVTYTAGAEDGFEDQTHKIAYGSATPEFIGEPTREGYTFEGWDKEISPSVAGDVVYTAVWSKNHVHDPIMIDGIEPTCIEDGYRSYYECVDCGFYEDRECTIRIADVDEWIEADGNLPAGHFFVDEITDAEHLVAGTGLTCLDPAKYYYGCVYCDAIGTEEWTSDEYGEHDIDTSFTASEGQHYHICLREGCDFATEKVDCFGGTATCENKAICSECGEEYGELASHTPNADDGDCTTAIVCSVCGEEITPAESDHKDENGDGKCDLCEYDMPVPPETDTETETATDTETDTDTETETATDTETETETETDTESGTESESNTEIETDPESETDVQTVSETDPETETDPTGTTDSKKPTNDSGMSTEAVIAIVTSSIVLGGAGIFALTQFIIKKKKL